jgi:hypothetical protein
MKKVLIQHCGVVINGVVDGEIIITSYLEPGAFHLWTERMLADYIYRKGLAMKKFFEVPNDMYIHKRDIRKKGHKDKKKNDYTYVLKVTPIEENFL